MKQADRMAALEAVLATFLGASKDSGYVVLETASERDQYVQFRMRDGTVCGEVGSRQWQEPERPLPADAVAGLAALGFSGGGPEQNYVKDGLPASAPELAALAETLLRTAYALDDEYAFTVHQMFFNDVPLPRTQRFTRELIERHLRDHNVKFLRDDEGDFRADFLSGEMPGPVWVWLCANGDQGSILQVTSFAPQGPRPATREQALERCNEWNNEHRWPKAFVAGTADDWWVGTSLDVDLSCGVTQPQLDCFAAAGVGAALEFWGWLGSTQPSEPPRRRGRR